MTTPVTQTTRTVSVRDVKHFTLGERPSATGPLAVLPGLDDVVATCCIAGPCPTQDLRLTITGLALTTDNPAVVLLQPRQWVNQDLGFLDEFAVQVIDTSATALQVLIRRLDGDSGWGQDLRLDIFIVGSVINP